MPITSHIERHFEATETVRDVVIGMADGLTVPFALAAGLSGTVEASTIVVIAGLAEIAAGSIAMGLGGYLAARTDLEHYISELKREWRETKEMPEEEADEVALEDLSRCCPTCWSAGSRRRCCYRFASRWWRCSPSGT